MANCDMECEDIKYETPLTPAPLPMPSDGGGHELVTELPDSGTPGVEYIVMGDPRDCSSFKGSYVWNNGCWVATSGAGGGALDNYTFEKTTTGWIAKKNNKVIFTYNDERITQNQTDITNIKNDIYNNYLVDRISVCEGGPLTLTVDATDPKKKKIKLCLDGDLGDKSDGAYEIKGTLSTYLSTAILGTTPVNVANVPSLNPADIVIGETYLYDHQGTMGKVTAYDKTTGIMTVQTMTTSPGERAGVRLGAVETKPELPTTITAAEGLGWLTPVEGDFAYVRQDGPDGKKLGEWLVQSIDAAGNITWAFSHYINAGNYVVDVLLSDGTLIPKNPDGTVTLPNYVRTVELADGTVLPVDAQGKVTLPDFGMLKGVRTSDGTLLTIAADGTVTLPVIPKKFDTYKIETSYKDWLNVKTDIDKVMTIDPAKLVGITKEGAAMTVANFATDVLPNRDLIYVHGVDGTNETQEAIAWFDSYNATTGIKLRILAIPRGGGGGGGADKEVPEYTRDLHAGDKINHLELITYDNVLYRMIDTAPYTLTGTWATDKTHFEVINSEAKNTYYNLNRDGREQGSIQCNFNETQISSAHNTDIVFGMTLKSADGMEMVGANGIRLEAGKRYQIDTFMTTQDVSGSGTVTDMYYYLWDDTNNVKIAQVMLVDRSDSKLFGAGVASNQYTVPDTGDIVLRVKMPKSAQYNSANAKIRGGGLSSITIQEIGRTVDPVAYLLNDGDAQEMPVGSLIQIMSNSAPKHYLVCDGSAYTIGTYPELEAHFLKEFGSVTHFGTGTAANTYKVPDLRGEFLRMTGTNGHTNAGTGKAEGSGAAVGVHQPATLTQNNAFVGKPSTAGTVAPTLIDYGAVNPDSSSASNGTAPACQGYVNLNGTRYNSDYGTILTTRPTNTSVNVAIKCESTPRVVIDQGTYKATADLKYVLSDSVMVHPKLTAVQDDTTCVKNSSYGDGQAFVAPVDGYYAYSFMLPEPPNISNLKYHATYIYRNNDLIGGEDRDDSSDDLRVPMNTSGLVKMKAGDELQVRFYLGWEDTSVTSITRTGSASFSLVNTITDHKVAEMMLKPNLWTPGVEQSFGDGVYGKRIKGTMTLATTLAATGTASFGVSGVKSIISQGGIAARGDSNYIGMGVGGAFNEFNAAVWLKRGNKDLELWLARPRDTSNTTIPSVFSSTVAYDVWVLYTK